MLRGLLGMKVPVLSGSLPQTVINCTSENPVLKDRQGVPLELPTQMIIRTDDGQPEAGPGGAGHDQIAGRLEWGSGGGSSIFEFGTTSTSLYGWPLLPQGTVFPVTGSWVRYSVIPNGTSNIIGGAHVSVGVAQPLIMRATAWQSPAAGGNINTPIAPALGASDTTFIPKYVSRFRIIPEALQPIGFTFSNQAIGGGGADYTIGAGTLMEWMPAQPYYRGLVIRNDGPVNSLDFLLDLEMNFC